MKRDQNIFYVILKKSLLLSNEYNLFLYVDCGGMDIVGNCLLFCTLLFVFSICQDLNINDSSTSDVINDNDSTNVAGTPSIDNHLVRCVLSCIYCLKWTGAN